MRPGPTKHPAQTDFQTPDVTRPILAVSKLCDGGAQVMFNRIIGEARLPDGLSSLFDLRGGEHVMRAQVMGGERGEEGQRQPFPSHS